MIYTCLETVQLDGYERGGCALLANQRDGFRQLLRDIPGLNAKSMYAFNTMFVSLTTIPRGSLKNSSSLFRAGFIVLPTIIAAAL